MQATRSDIKKFKNTKQILNKAKIDQFLPELVKEVNRNT